MEETKEKIEIIENVDVEDIGWECEEAANHCQSVGDLEENILSCLLQKPELMKELILTEDDFYTRKRLFKYFKAFYDIYGTIDYVLMCHKCKKGNVYELRKAFDNLILLCFPTIKNFKLYQEELLKYNKEHQKELKEQQQKDEILKLSLKLSHDEITLKEYFKEIKKMEEEFTKCIL